MAIIPHSLIRESVSSLYASGGLPRGAKTGWPAVDKLYTVGMGQWTVVTGLPNSGKSEWLDGLMVNLAKQGDWRFFIYSPENQPLALHHAKILEKYIGKPFDPGPTIRMEPDELEAGEDWMEGKFHFCKPERPEMEAILCEGIDRVCSAGERWKTGVIIDPWNFLEHHRPPGMSETEYVSDCLSRVIEHVRAHYVHLWLVAHPAKMMPRKDGTYAIPGPRDISGCHDDKTEVLTARGWIKHADVTQFDRVACFDPKTEKLQYAHPEKVWAFEYNGEMVRIKSDSFDALVTPNHRMVVRPIWRRKPSLAVRLKANGRGRPLVFPMDETWSFVHADELVGQLEMPWATEFVGGVDADEIAGMNADDMLKFIGWWVAEGWVEGALSLGICQGVGLVAAEMRDTMQRLGILTCEREDAPRRPRDKATMWKGRVWRRANKVICDWIIAECGRGAQNKRLPTVIWSLGVRQKQILLEALIDGDGSRSKARPGHSSYATVSPVLADQVQRLAIECGHMASIYSSARGLPHHKRKYQVNIGRATRTAIGIEPKRHVTRENYKGMVYCLTVPGGAYLVRRDGKPGIYGNSAHFWNKTDNAITVHRDQVEGSQDVQIHVLKVRFKHCGHIGTADLIYDRITGRYNSKPSVASYYEPKESNVAF